MVTPERALSGRTEPLRLTDKHYVLGTPLRPPYPAGLEVAVFGLGCFWGAERLFWNLDGVYTTAAGYAGGYTANPTYEEVCSGKTGHAEAVQVVYDPAKTSYADLLKIFWEAHDPTQEMRQGNDVGTQYRSAIFVTSDAQRALADATAASFGSVLRSAGYGAVATEIAPLGEFYFAEEYHQQYLAKVPHGYCGLAGTGQTCSVGVAKTE
ncbi:MAG: peptide-methionine (S)-S-oxide reductase MsrA [Actinomycetota bacterium]